MKRNALMQKLAEQHDLIISLQDQLDAYMYRSYPTLG